LKIKILIVFIIVTGLILTLFSVNAEDQAAVISKGKTATMHNSEGTEIAPVNDSFKIKYLTDGLYTSTAGTVWQTAVSGKYDVIFEIDLESLFEITGVTLTQRGNTCYPIDFTIDVWDGMNWTTAKSVTDNKPTDPDINVTDKDVTTAWKTELNMAGYELKTG